MLQTHIVGNSEQYVRTHIRWFTTNCSLNHTKRAFSIQPSMPPPNRRQYSMDVFTGKIVGSPFIKIWLMSTHNIIGRVLCVFVCWTRGTDTKNILIISSDYYSTDIVRVYYYQHLNQTNRKHRFKVFDWLTFWSGTHILVTWIEL